MIDLIRFAGPSSLAIYPCIERIFPDAEESFGVFVNGIEISPIQCDPAKHQPDGSKSGGKLEIEAVDISSPGIEDIHQPGLALVPRRGDDPEPVTGDEDLADVVIELLRRRPVVVRALLARIRRPLDLAVLSRDRFLDLVGFGVEVVDPVVDTVNDVDGIKLLVGKIEASLLPAEPAAEIPAIGELERLADVLQVGRQDAERVGDIIIIASRDLVPFGGFFKERVDPAVEQPDELEKIGYLSPVFAQVVAPRVETHDLRRTEGLDQDAVRRQQGRCPELGFTRALTALDDLVYEPALRVVLEMLEPVREVDAPIASDLELVGILEHDVVAVVSDAQLLDELDGTEGLRIGGLLGIFDDLLAETKSRRK